jgi:hypothetical protein
MTERGSISICNQKEKTSTYNFTCNFSVATPLATGKSQLQPHLQLEKLCGKSRLQHNCNYNNLVCDPLATRTKSVATSLRTGKSPL